VSSALCPDSPGTLDSVSEPLNYIAPIPKLRHRASHSRVTHNPSSGSNGRDYDEEYHDPYRPNASPLQQMPNPEDFAGGQRINMDTRDRLLAQPTVSAS
jgi:hypothetical protein